MIEVVGNIWDWYDKAATLLVTTNGVVRRDGACVMGAGIAQQAKKRFPRFPFALGKHILTYGNVPGFFPSYGLISFPVKHHWQDDADLELIEQSAKDIARVISILTSSHIGSGWHPEFVSVRPGCGNGRLQWNTVKPLIAPWFDRAAITIVNQ